MRNNKKLPCNVSLKTDYVKLELELFTWKDHLFYCIVAIAKIIYSMVQE